jgi:hypothetical protein
MQISNVSTPITEHVSTIFVATELSQRSLLVTLHCPDKDKTSRHKLGGGDHACLLALIDRIRDRSGRVPGVVPAVASCCEAGYDGFWRHRLHELRVRPCEHSGRSAGAAGKDRPDRTDIRLHKTGTHEKLN